MSTGAAPVPYFTLNNGVKMPGVGKGCWLGPEGGLDIAEEMCRNALRVGYRHIDTAAGYKNEEQVGKAIRESGIPREEIFVTTKLKMSDAHRVREAFEDSLKALDIGYIDLYLVHWPLVLTPDWSRTLSVEEHPNFVDVWADMEKLLDTGNVRAIGISNFSIQHLETLLLHAKVVPVINQVEIHPYLPQHELKAYCEAHGILLTAYSPFGQGNSLFFSDPDFAKIAETHQVTPAQVVISWLVQRGTPPVAKSANVDRMRANISLVELSSEEMHIIDDIHKKPGAHRGLVKYDATEGTAFGWTYEQLGWNRTKEGFVKD
ncbi:aldo/keto reductase [Phanerochaete sordida]|uniref:Aldo/keto reductase n=1 Tax=Phanerochaete sordida TaxID=48140 RepID=A0A9P3G9K3_9APHY|nr:aldo/keto reductase [Phanerochaete sordida]